MSTTHSFSQSGNILHTKEEQLAHATSTVSPARDMKQENALDAQQQPTTEAHSNNEETE